VAHLVGWTVIAAAAALLLVTWLWLQRSSSQVILDLLTMIAGFTAAVGGLMVIVDVSAASWVLAPLLVAGGAMLHRRVLFHGEGPFRT